MSDLLRERVIDRSPTAAADASSRFDRAATTLANMYNGEGAYNRLDIDDRLGLMNKALPQLRAEAECPSPSTQEVAHALAEGRRVVGQVLFALANRELGMVFVDTHHVSEHPWAIAESQTLDYRPLGPAESAQLAGFVALQLNGLRDMANFEHPLSDLGLYQVIIEPRV